MDKAPEEIRWSEALGRPHPKGTLYRRADLVEAEMKKLIKEGDKQVRKVEKERDDFHLELHDLQGRWAKLKEVEIPKEWYSYQFYYDRGPGFPIIHFYDDSEFKNCIGLVYGNDEKSQEIADLIRAAPRLAAENARLRRTIAEIKEGTDD